MPFIDLCEVVNRGVITPCLRCCANSVPVQLGPGPQGRRDPPAALASLADTFAGIIDREPAGPAGHFVTGVSGQCSVAFAVHEGRRCSRGQQKVQSAGEQALAPRFSALNQAARPRTSPGSRGLDPGPSCPAGGKATPREVR